MVYYTIKPACRCMEWFYEEAQLYDILLLESVILPQ